MERIIRGIMRYRNTTREQMVQEFIKVKNDPHVSAFPSNLNLISLMYQNNPLLPSSLFCLHFSQKQYFSHVWIVE